jgi:predicted nucleic acid-binding protein
VSKRCSASTGSLAALSKAGPGKVDPKDTPFVALTIELDGRLWTGDKALVRGLRAQGFDRFYPAGE